MLLKMKYFAKFARYLHVLAEKLGLKIIYVHIIPTIFMLNINLPNIDMETISVCISLL